MGDRYRDELCLIHDLSLFRLRGQLLTHLQLQFIITTVQEKKAYTTLRQQMGPFWRQSKIHIWLVLSFDYQPVLAKVARTPLEVMMKVETKSFCFVCLFICVSFFFWTESDLIFDFDGPRFALDPIQASSGQMYLIFTSNYLRNESGFKATTKKYQVIVGK